MFLTFKGGVHIPGCKEITNSIPIRTVEGCDVHVFPLQQHIGAPIEPCVNVGDYVYAGQPIATSQSFVSVPLHSSVSGTVIKIEPHLHPSGAMVTSVFVKNDFKNEIYPEIKPVDDIDSMTKEEMLDVVKNAGIVGMGGAGFPTHVKLSPPPEKKITHLIVNGAECEPYLTSDHRRMIEEPEKIIGGLEIAMKILSLDEGYIGIEKNKQGAIEILSEKANDGNGIHVLSLKTKYPQGAEKQLIYAVTKRRVPSGGLPADVGAVVLNIDTVYSIYNAFHKGLPLMHRIVTMSGDCFKNPCNLCVPLGVSFEYLVEQAGGFEKSPKKVIMGGPMMGIAQYTLNVPAIKTTSCILALSKAVTNYNQETPCIRCGKCVDRCPMGLSPLYLSRYAVAGELDKCEKLNILDCIECGVCAYLCPGLQGPLANIRIAKQQILENRRKNK